MKNIGILFFLAGWLLVGGCQKGGMGRRSRTASAESIQNTNWDTKRKQGIDFTAFGQNPGWALDIDFAKAMQFWATNGTSVTISVPKPKPTDQSGGVLLDARSGLRRMKVTIDANVCKDRVSGRDFAYSVTVEASGKRYEGCGIFLRGADRLNGTWMLESFRGQRLRAEIFAEKRLPQLEIDLNANRLVGFGGCNMLRGKVKADGDHIELDVAPATRQSCSSAFESSFLSALQNVTLYRTGRNRLTLLSNGQYVMTFRKTG